MHIIPTSKGKPNPNEIPVKWLELCLFIGSI